MADLLSIGTAVADEDRRACEAFVAMPVDPVIRAVLPPTMAKAIAKRREEYRAALRAHDWTFEDSACDENYRRGVTERAKLETLGQSLDPGWSIWNEEAPARFSRVADLRRSGELDFGAWALPGVAS